MTPPLGFVVQLLVVELVLEVGLAVVELVAAFVVAVAAVEQVVGTVLEFAVFELLVE